MICKDCQARVRTPPGWNQCPACGTTPLVRWRKPRPLSMNQYRVLVLLYLGAELFRDPNQRLYTQWFFRVKDWRRMVALFDPEWREEVERKNPSGWLYRRSHSLTIASLQTRGLVTKIIRRDRAMGRHIEQYGLTPEAELLASRMAPELTSHFRVGEPIRVDIV